MIIEKVDNIKDTIECDKLLTKLVDNERKYDIKSDYIVKRHFYKKDI